VIDITADGLLTNLKCIEYKAKVLDVPIFVVDPKNTSRQCPNPECQYIDKRNRKTRDIFLSMSSMRVYCNGGLRKSNKHKALD